MIESGTTVDNTTVDMVWIVMDTLIDMPMIDMEESLVIIHVISLVINLVNNVDELGSIADSNIVLMTRLQCQKLMDLRVPQMKLNCHVLTMNQNTMRVIMMWRT